MTPAPKTCSVLEHRCGDFGDNGVSAVFVAYADLANSGDVTRLTAPGLSNQGVESVFCRADRPSNGKAVRGNAQIVAPTKKGAAPAHEGPGS